MEPANGGYRPLSKLDTVPLDAPQSDVDIVQFATNIFIVRTDEGKIQCDIMRLGRSSGTLSFTYKTIGGSARAGHQFVHTEGMITMEPGEDSAMIEVPIIVDEHWNPTTEFTVVLGDPDGCALGLYLKVGRVKVMDSTIYPSPGFKDDIAKGHEGIDKISDYSLFGAVMSQMLHQEGMRWRTFVVILLDSLKNVYEYLRLILSIYMVDKVFNLESTEGLMIAGDRVATAYVVAALIVCPMFVLFAADHWKAKLNIGGYLRRDLSRNLFRKFMNYSSDSLADVPHSDMVVAVTQDVGAVTGGYVKLVDMARVAGKVGISVYFTLSEAPNAWWATILVPVLMLLWAMSRKNAYMQTSAASISVEEGMVIFVNETMAKIPLISYYQQRPQINEFFADKTESLRTIEIPEAQVVLNNKFFPKVLGPALIALYTAIGVKLVLDKGIKLGVFLATLNVLGNICSSFEELFGLNMEILKTFNSLKGLVYLLNKTTDLAAWQAVNRKRRATTKDLRSGMLETRRSSKVIIQPDSSYVPAVDEMAITMQNVTYHFPGQRLLIKNVSVSCKQGKICEVIEGPGCRSFLCLLAHVIFPDPAKCSIFVPSHLRVMFVPRECVMLNLSIWQNLVFGNAKGNNPYRVEKILLEFGGDGPEGGGSGGMVEILKMCKDELAQRKTQFDAGVDSELIDAEDTVRDPQAGANLLDRLSDSDKANISYARALIANPEVLVMYRPFSNFFSEARQSIFCRALTQHRDNRGYKMPEATIAQRRPRTVFFSRDAALTQLEDVADYAWEMPQKELGLWRQGPPGELSITRKSARNEQK